MIDSSPELKTILEQDNTLKIRTGCTFEYNMNSLVDNITVTGVDINRSDEAGNVYQPFKKLFPVDSIVKSTRPNGAGIRYAIIGDIGLNTYRNPRVSQYNIDYRTYYPGTENTYKYYVSDKSTGLDVTVTYPKQILTNKIIIKFELSHSTPPTWTLFSGLNQLASGTSSQIIPFKTGNIKNHNAGTLTLYYNGTSWSTSEPSTIAAPVSLNTLRLTTEAVSDKYIGLIEISPKWVVDVSDRVVEFGIAKESSSTVEDILPVGSVSANSISLKIASYEDPRTTVPFDKTFNFDSSKVYMYKRVEVLPYFKVYHSAGQLSDSNGTYEKVEQGVYYMDNWSSEEFGDISITALDGAKILQETIAPSLICEGYTVIAIIRSVLDSIGFTNYNFNTTENDSSIFSPRFWWTDDGRTVWEGIQQLCRDSQMTAVFDENNVLQFYTREYLFNANSATSWSLRYEKDGNNLPNIIQLSKSDLSSANQVKILWNSVTTNRYVGNSQPLWKSGNSFMGALSLEQNLPSTAGPGDYMTLKAVVTNEYQQGQILGEYNGYVVIDSEIIEYDAIEYFYIDENDTKNYVDIANESDALKFLGLGKVGVDNYGPTNRYRIKTRGAFDTDVIDHIANAQGIVDSWDGYEVTWA